MRLWSGRGAIVCSRESARAARVYTRKFQTGVSLWEPRLFIAWTAFFFHLGTPPADGAARARVSVHAPPAARRMAWSLIDRQVCIYTGMYVYTYACVLRMPRGRFFPFSKLMGVSNLVWKAEWLLSTLVVLEVAD